MIGTAYLGSWQAYQGTWTIPRYSDFRLFDQVSSFVLSFRPLHLFRSFRFGHFACFSRFVLVVSFRSFWSFRSFQSFRFGGFVSLFRVLVHAHFI